MKILGIAPSSTHLKWALMHGTRKNPEVLKLPSYSQKLPTDAVDGHALLSLRRLLTTFLEEQAVERVTILEAGKSQYGGASAARLKAEGIIQLVGAEIEIPVDLVPPQSLRAQEKAFAGVAGAKPEQTLNAGAPFNSKQLRDAFLVAWWGLGA